MVLVVGLEGTRQLGEYLAQFHVGKGRRVDTLLGFDRGHKVSLYQVGVREHGSRVAATRDMDMVLGLSGSSLAFESRLRTDGAFLIDASAATSTPLRKDIRFVVVPAISLAEAVVADTGGDRGSLDYRELVGPVFFGAALSMGQENPTVSELSRVFTMFHEPPVNRMVMAAYEGYDWVQDRQMRAKSLMVGARE